MKIRGQKDELPPALFWWDLAVYRFRRMSLLGQPIPDFKYREAVAHFRLHAGDDLASPAAVGLGH